ncbi:MAG: hypothetical protein Q8L68_01670 [Methylococcales bacterium]|nr:hypothetical protein [Methylococcales bacterium]
MKIIKFICYHAFSLLLRVIVWIMGFVIKDSDSIEFCPLCKKYRVEGIVWDLKPTDLEGYERAKIRVCCICANMLKEKDPGYAVAVDALPKE